jgi:hypothetical protein
MKKIIAMDPGVAGAIVILQDGKILEAHNMPIFKIEKPPKKGKKKPTMQAQVDFKGIFNILEPHFGDNNEKPEIYVEEITHLFGLPSSSNFKLGYAAGVLHAAVQTFADEFYLVPPKKWQAGVWDEADKCLKPNKRVDTGATSKNAFARIFAGYEGKLKSEGIRDAALIAWYGHTGGL